MIITEGFIPWEVMIIAAIAISRLTDSKVRRHEPSAVASIRSISRRSGSSIRPLAKLTIGGADPCTRSRESACLLVQSRLAGNQRGSTTPQAENSGRVCRYFNCREFNPEGELSERKTSAARR